MDNVNVIREGFLAPEFSLPDSSGEVFSLKDNLKDKFTALCFFSDSGSEYVQNNLKDFNNGLPKTASGVVIEPVAISPEKADKLAKLRNKLKLMFPILSDANFDVSKRYYVVDSSKELPAVHFTVIVVDDEGIVRYRISSPHEKTGFDLLKFRSNLGSMI